MLKPPGRISRILYCTRIYYGWWRVCSVTPYTENAGRGILKPQHDMDAGVEQAEGGGAIKTHHIPSHPLCALTAPLRGWTQVHLSRCRACPSTFHTLGITGAGGNKSGQNT